jgi:DNA-binding ferritin-like protein
MSAFQAPYKAVLVSLYEYAIQSDNEKLGKRIKEVFDLQFDDMPERFRMLGLDDSLVRPSYVINTISLQEKIRRSQEANPELNYHKDNEEFLANIMKEIAIITRKGE